MSAVRLLVRRTLRVAVALVAVVAAGPGLGAGGQDATPSVEYLLPWRVAAGSSRVRVTVHGTGLEECAVVALRRDEAVREVPAHRVGRTLVFTLPEELTATPGAISVRVGDGRRSSRDVGIQVVEMADAAQPAEPFVSKVTPAEVVLEGEVRLLLQGENIDPQAFVFLRAEGRSEDGVRLPVSYAEHRLEVRLSRSAVPESGAYELRVVNPTARLSNWVRIQVRRKS
jgi:hypothetical protein